MRSENTKYYVLSNRTKMENVCDRKNILRKSSNAKNVSEAGVLIAIAKVGSTLKDGTVIKKQLVGGEMSEGMVLDAPLLNWKSGSHGLAAILPSDERKPLFFKAGDKVPRSRPRSGGSVHARCRSGGGRCASRLADH